MSNLRSALRFPTAALAAFVVIGSEVSIAETPEEAIKRIQSGRHSQMPAPVTAPASGAAGKGVTIENGTGYTLTLHFSGPVGRTVAIRNGESESI